MIEKFPMEDSISGVIRAVQDRFRGDFSDDDLRAVMNEHNLPASKLSEIKARLGIKPSR